MIKAIGLKNIENKIYTIRGNQVMLDRDLAVFYDVETRTLNQAVKRNIQRFPYEFCFQLTKEEYHNWISQFVISNFNKMGLRRAPYAFTEQGVAMLSTILKSKVAVKVSVQIMNAFVTMRRFMLSNAQVFQRLDSLEIKQIATDKKIDEVFNAIESKTIQPKQGIFFDGQVFDAYQFVSQIIRSAQKSIILIDNYVDDTTLTQFTKKKSNVKLIIYTKKISKELKLDSEKFKKQYFSFEIKEFKEAHDRFLIIDKKVVYHFGASLKDLGKKWFAFSKMDIDVLNILQKINLPIKK